MKNSARLVLLFIGDLGTLVAAFFAMLAVSFSGPIVTELVESHLVPFSILILLWLFIFFLFNLYDTQLVKPTIPHLQRIAIAFLVAIAVGVVFFYTMPIFGITPKTNLLIFGGFSFLTFLAWRRIFYSVFASHFKKNVIFITNNENNSYVEELISYITTYPQSGFALAGVYASVKDFFEKNNNIVDTIIISKNVIKNSEDFKKLYAFGKHILDISYAYEDILGKIPTDSIDETWFLHNIRRSNRSLYEGFGRIISILLAGIGLVITSPFLFLTGILVKLQDGGPIFYTHLRTGKNGKEFKLYKFRSMIVNADANGAFWTEPNDPRITKIGKLIRKIHIDEVPQLWNVLRGDMALVGPRPELPGFIEKLEKEIPHYNLRHIITPGFTGWAQIKYRNARGVAESKEKFEHDLYYIKNRNIFMDIGIILRTIIIIFTHD